MKFDTALDLWSDIHSKKATASKEDLRSTILVVAFPTDPEVFE